MVDLEDGFFGAVGAVFGFVLAFDDGEGVHDVGCGHGLRSELSKRLDRCMTMSSSSSSVGSPIRPFS